MKKLAWISLVLGIASFLSVQNLLADEGSSEQTAKALKEISEKQDQIIQSLADLKSELQIVKIRVSSR